MKIYEKTRTSNKYYDVQLNSRKRKLFSKTYEIETYNFSEELFLISDTNNNQKTTKSNVLSEQRELHRNSISTEKANEYQEKAIQEQYEQRSTEQIQKRVSKKKHDAKKKLDNEKNIAGTTPSTSTVNKTNAKTKTTTIKKGNTKASKTTGTKVLGKLAAWQSVVNLGKAFLPEALRAKNYSLQKNQQRIKYLSDGAEGDLEVDAGRKTKTIFTRLFDRIREAHLSLSVIIGHFNIYAGLAFFFIPILVVLVGFIIFGAELGIHLPFWAYNQQYTVRQLMTQYEYYWECVSIETSSSVEDKYGNGKTVAVPVYYNLGAYSEEELVRIATAENFINWREVLAVYYAYYSKETELPATELNPLIDDEVIEYLFTEENNSKFNEIFWTMNCIMPAGSELTYKADELTELTDNTKSGISINLCYHPSLSVVEDRLGFDFYQKDMVTKYLSPEYDEYFEPLIEHRHVSSSQYVVETALAELDNTGEKYAPSGTQWCCLFVDWVLHQTGNDMLRSHPSGCTQAIHGGDGYPGWENTPDIAYVYYLADAKPQSINPQAGWIVFFNNSGDTDKLEHIGIVESYDPVINMLTTVEGNTYHQQGEPYRVCEMHRTSWDNIYCFVELKYPIDNLDPTSQYPDDYAACLEYSDSYEDICNVAIKTIKGNEAINQTIKQTAILVANHGTAEWSVNEAQVYQPVSAVEYISKHAADKSLPKNLNDWECDTGIYTFSDHFTKYSAYFVKRTRS